MDQLHIKYEKEKVFKDLKYKGHLRFDFEILIDNEIKKEVIKFILSIKYL